MAIGGAPWGISGWTMDSVFDPYRKWLGVRTAARPPNHYDLLGLEWFETDGETISHAADQRIAYVRTLAVGEFTDLSQRLLNELATARVCLLNAARKAEYDRRLREILTGDTVPAEHIAAVAAPMLRPTQAAAASQPSHAPPKPPRKAMLASFEAAMSNLEAVRNLRTTLTIAASTFIGLITLAILLVVYARNWGEDTSQPIVVGRVERKPPQADSDMADQPAKDTGASASAPDENKQENAEPKVEQPVSEDGDDPEGSAAATPTPLASGDDKTMREDKAATDLSEEAAGADAMEGKNAALAASDANEATAEAPTEPVLDPVLVNSIGMELVLIPPGKFLMGAGVSKRPYEVRITRPFYLGKHEVTVAQYGRFVAETNYEPESGGESVGWLQGHGLILSSQRPALTFRTRARNTVVVAGPSFSWTDPGFKQEGNHPVVLTSWGDAQQFCRWLSAKEGRQYRLPSEAEWEYACGEAPLSLEGFANASDLALHAMFPQADAMLDDSFTFTAPIGSLQPNAFGLFDMFGNASEWVSDRYDDLNALDAGDREFQGTAAPQWVGRVVRGGDWQSSPQTCVKRQAYQATQRSCTTGFRIALAPKQATSQPIIADFSDASFQAFVDDPNNGNEEILRFLMGQFSANAAIAGEARTAELSRKRAGMRLSALPEDGPPGPSPATVTAREGHPRRAREKASLLPTCGVDAIDSVQIVAGGDFAVHVRVTRLGRDGPVKVTLTDLPEGVKANPAELAANESEADVKIEVDHTVRAGRATCRLLAELAGSRTERKISIDVLPGLRLVREFRGHRGTILAVAFSPDGQFAASSGNDKSVRVWQIASGKQKTLFRTENSAVHKVCFSPDGKRLAAADGSKLRIWDLEGGRPEIVNSAHTSTVRGLAFFPDGKTLISDAVGEPFCRLFNLTSMESESGFEEIQFLTSTKRVRAFKERLVAHEQCDIAFSAAGRHVVIMRCGLLRIWDAAGKKLLLKINVNGRMAASRDGTQMLTGRPPVLWSLESLRQVRKLSTNLDEDVLGFSADGQAAFLISPSLNHKNELGTICIRSGGTLARSACPWPWPRYENATVISPDARHVLKSRMDGKEHVAQLWALPVTEDD